MSISVSYYSFSPSRADAKWEVDGTEKISELKRIYEKDAGSIKDVDEEELLWELREIDSEFGGVYQVSGGLVFEEEPWSEVFCLDALCEVYQLILQDEVPTKEEWIRLYSELNAAKTEKAVQSLAQKIELPYSEAEEFLISYLQEVRPVVRDLKETKDSIFVRNYYDGEDASPKSSHYLLQSRAVQLLEKLSQNT